MKRRKFIAGAAAALISLTMVFSQAGCSGGSGSGSGPLRVGMELAYPPFETKNDAGEPMGVGVDLANALGEHLGRDVVIENIAWDGLIPSLQSGKVDVVISSMTITDERSKVVDFSDPYAKAYLSFLVNDKSPAKKVSDLNNEKRTIAVKKGTTGEIFVREKLPKAKVNALSSENAAVTEVVQGKADAFIYDQWTVYSQLLEHAGEVRLMIIEDQKPDEWGIAVKKDNTELRDDVNEFLKKFRADGGFDKITEKHLAEQKAVFDAQGFPWFFDK